jgi:hypothetical protein
VKFSRNSLSANPNNPEILYSWGKSLKLESRIYGPKFARTRLLEADAKLRRACDLQRGQFNLNQYFVRVDVLLQLASHYVSEKPKEYDYLEEAHRCFSLINKQDPEFFEKSIYKKCIDFYLELTPINLVDHLELSILDGLKIHHDQIEKKHSIETREKCMKESREKIMASYVCAYHWHRLFLEYKYSGTIIVQAADILRRWATFMVLNDMMFSENIFARSGQILEMAFIRSKLVCPVPGKVRSMLIELSSSSTLTPSMPRDSQLFPKRDMPTKAFMKEKPVHAGNLKVKFSKKWQTSLYCMVIDSYNCRQ